MTPFRITRRVEFCDTDMAGIVHFSNFFRYMEFAEVEFLRTKGLSVKLRWGDQLLGFPRVSAHCDYRKPAFFGDLLEIAVTLVRVGDKSVTYAFEFHRGPDLLAQGQVTSVCCRISDGNELESATIPQGIRDRLLE